MFIDFTSAIANGLTEADAAARLARYGPNELPSKRGRGVLWIAWDVIREPMFLLLLACGGVYLTLGDVRDAAILLGFVFMVLGIMIVQDHKAVCPFSFAVR
jgi:Ca2+-transporting ATPase